MKQKSGFHHFYRAFIEANKKKLKGESPTIKCFHIF